MLTRLRRVTGAPSRVTSYVVLGTGAGPKKLEVIKKQNLKTLNEDQFLELIGTRYDQAIFRFFRLIFLREAVLDDKTIAKMKKEDEKMKKDAEEMVQRELKVAKSASKTVKPSASVILFQYRRVLKQFTEILHPNSGLQNMRHSQ